MEKMIETTSPLKVARLSKGWTLEELARKAGLTRTGLWLIERRNSTKASTALRLGRILGIAPTRLFPRIFTSSRFLKQGSKQIRNSRSADRRPPMRLHNPSTRNPKTSSGEATEVRVTLDETTTIVNAARIMVGVDKDIELQGGEVIIVPTYPRILVSGAVGRPSWVTAQYLSEAISVAGGPLPEADLQNVELRTQSDTPIRIDAQAIFSGRTDDIRLNDRDRITIPIKPRTIAPNVQVYGPVERPGTQQGFTVADAVREANPDTRADLTQVIIDRGRGETVTVNARDIAMGHALDQDLRTGDRVLIPRRPEAAANPTDTPQTVTVIGDVKTPGQFRPGTLTQILASAGGVTNTARTSAIRVRLPNGGAQTCDLAKIAQGTQDNPALPDGTTVYVESDLPCREAVNSFRTFIGIFSAIAILGLKLGG